MINFSYLYAQQEFLEPHHTQGLTIPCDQISEDMLRAKALLHGLLQLLVSGATVFTQGFVFICLIQGSKLALSSSCCLLEQHTVEKNNVKVGGGDILLLLE